PGAHQINSSKNTVVSPVDARVDQFGIINNTSLIQAKGVEYSLKNLIPSDMANHFINGTFITLYLSPADYHRIHSPVSGKIRGYFLVPGKLFPVHEVMVGGIKNLFSKNERSITYIETDMGKVAVCKIGAMNVGRISLSYADVISNKAFRKRKELLYNDKDIIDIKAGNELGMFHLGSTIILVFQKDIMNFEKLNYGQKVRMGEKIGSLR
ncbi:archaetidylserine decarboxylase, partial [Spirochaetota bacterium]